MGISVREKDKGTGVYWLFGRHEGRRFSKKIGDKKTAQEIAEKLGAQIVLGEFNVSSAEDDEQVPTFKDYAPLWLDEFIRVTRKASTYERYQGILINHVYPDLGKYQIDKIKRKDVRNLLLSVHGRGLSKSTICLVRDVISGVFHYALDDELVLINPVVGVTKKMNLGKGRKKVSPFEAEEVIAFQDACLEYEPEYFALFLIGFRTGMRMGEILALNWDDINWKGKFIEVTKSFRKGTVDDPKTYTSQRRVDMSKQLAACLRNLYNQRQKAVVAGGKGGDIIFPKNGKHLSQNSLRNVFKRLLKKAGIQVKRFHDIRHTFASMLLTNGESLVYVKEQMGHSSIRTTVDIYGKWIPSSNRDAVNALDALAPVGTPVAP